MDGYTKEIVYFFSNKKVKVRKFPTEEEVDKMIDYIIFNKNFIPLININEKYNTFGGKSLIQIILEKSSITKFCLIAKNYYINEKYFIKSTDYQKEACYFKILNKKLKKKILNNKLEIYIVKEEILLSFGFIYLLESFIYFIINGFLTNQHLINLINNFYYFEKLIISPVIILTQEDMASIYLFHIIYYILILFFLLFTYLNNMMQNYNLDYFSFFFGLLYI